MVSRENAVILTCIAGAVAVAVGIEATGVAYPSWFPVTLLIGGGVVLPQLVNEYLGETGPA